MDERSQRIGPDDRLDGVMLSRPRSLESTAVDHLQEMQHLARHIIQRHLRAYADAIYRGVRSELENVLEGLGADGRRPLFDLPEAHRSLTVKAVAAPPQEIILANTVQTGDNCCRSSGIVGDAVQDREGAMSWYIPFRPNDCPCQVCGSLPTGKRR